MSKNANQNHQNSMPPQSERQSSRNSVWQGCQQKRILNTAGRIVTVQPLWKVLKVDLPCDPYMPLLGIYSEVWGNTSQRYLHITVYCSLFTPVKLWSQPGCPTMEGWIKKMYVHNVIVFDHKDEKGNQLERIILSLLICFLSLWFLDFI